MKKIVSTSFIILILYCNCFPQIFDDFADGEYESNPVKWEDPAGSFSASEGMLSLSAATGFEKAYIRTKSNYSQEASWEFRIKLDFNSSAYNYAEIYLTADGPDLDGHINGHFVRVGGARDEISLFRRGGFPDQVIKLIDGPDGMTDLDLVDLRIRASVAAGGTWQLSVSDASDNYYTLIGSGVDPEIPSCNYFAIMCFFTPSRNDKFHFDDIRIAGKEIADITPPHADTVFCSGKGVLECRLNEKISPYPAADPENYSLEGTGSPDSAAYDPANAIIFLFWNILLDEDREYILTIRLLEDLAGNRTLDLHTSFIYHDIKPVVPGSVVINEIMTDPLPSAGLPGFEFVELMNTTGNYLLLDGCLLNNKEIERLVIPSKGFALLADDDAGNSFLKYAGVPGSVRFWDNLNNESDEVVLTGKNGEILDAVSYNKDWIDDINKKNGGWSFELINPGFKCWGRKSWKTSVASVGGTPGMINSVFSEKVENTHRGFDDYWAEGNCLWLDFADPMDGSMMTGNFSMTSNIVLDIAAEPAIPNQVRLSLSDSLDPGIPGTLVIRNLNDCSQTYRVDTSVSLGIGIEPSFLELIFTEIMIDPTPSHGLPEEEFIEIYNPTDKIISLAGCSLVAGSDTVELPDKNILPKEFRVLCRSAGDGIAFHRPVYVPGFPGINNEGERLSILNKDNTLVFDLDLNKNWFPGGFPAGISVEMTDINNPCGKASNWSPSSDRTGGSPGRINSNQSPNPDNLGPILESVSVIDELQVLLRFSEPVHAGSIIENNITVNGRRFVRDFKLINFTDIVCNTLESLKQGAIYELKIRNITDCVGNLMQNHGPINFGVPLPADSADIIINEVLFNPRAGGVDFIEILNRSEKFIDINQWQFSGPEGLNGDGGSFLFESSYILSPGSIKAFTTNRTRILNDFPKGNAANILEVHKIPAMNDDSGSIHVYSSKGKLVDRFDYDEEFHFPLLDNFHGVSLERVDPDKPTNDPVNWHSASERNGFGTPGNTNSTIPSDTSVSGKIDIIPGVFSPDGPDPLNEAFIYFNLGRPGFVANIFIFNINGGIIRRLANNELIPASGYFSWDGKSDNGSKAGMGYYIVIFEAFNLDGTRKIFKDKVAVGGSF